MRKFVRGSWPTNSTEAGASLFFNVFLKKLTKKLSVCPPWRPVSIAPTIRAVIVEFEDFCAHFYIHFFLFCLVSLASSMPYFRCTLRGARQVAWGRAWGDANVLRRADFSP